MGYIFLFMVGSIGWIEFIIVGYNVVGDVWGRGGY